jgi:3-methyladenine DNA glycosylase/8-oxoguanine DNA glycosylase
MRSLDERSLKKACKTLAAGDPHLRTVFDKHGNTAAVGPPAWIYDAAADHPGTAGFAGVGKGVFRQARDTIESSNTKETANAERCGAEDCSDFRDRKRHIARHLAESLVNKSIDLDDLSNRTDREVKSELMRLKGVGEWTSDIYLLMGCSGRT